MAARLHVAPRLLDAESLLDHIGDMLRIHYTAYQNDKCVRLMYDCQDMVADASERLENIMRRKIQDYVKRGDCMVFIATTEGYEKHPDGVQEQGDGGGVRMDRKMAEAEGHGLNQSDKQVNEDEHNGAHGEGFRMNGKVAEAEDQGMDHSKKQVSEEERNGEDGIEEGDVNVDDSERLVGWMCITFPEDSASEISREWTSAIGSSLQKSRTLEKHDAEMAGTKEPEARDTKARNPESERAELLLGLTKGLMREDRNTQELYKKLHKEQRVAVISTLVVDPEYQRRGIGLQLLESAVAAAAIGPDDLPRSIYAQVPEAYVELFERQDFEPVRSEEGFKAGYVVNLEDYKPASQRNKKEDLYKWVYMVRKREGRQDEETETKVESSSSGNGNVSDLFHGLSLKEYEYTTW